MPIPQQVPIISHTGNGVTTTFAYAFAVLDADDLKVRVGGVDVTTGFTVTGVGNRAGGTVVFAVAPANGAAIVLYRDVALVRTTDYQYAGDLREQVLDDDFDRMMMGLQDMLARINRAITIPAGETFATLPSVALRANKVMAFGPSGEIALLSSFGGGGGTIDIVPAELSVTTSKLANGAVTATKAAPTLVEDLLGYTPADEAQVSADIDALESSRALVGGSSAQVFEVGVATDPAHALRLGQINTANAAPVKTALNASGDPPVYACRAWVNFQGTGTVTIRASGNVASITDIGPGFYDVVFTTPMPDANYATILGSGNNAAGNHGSQQAVYHRAPATTFVAILAADDSGQSTAEDCPWVDVAIFR